MKLGLAFSGGKDSLACLLLHKHKLSEITVFWVNTGKSYKETEKLVNYVKTISPNFIEVLSNQQLQNETNGLPADVVPIDWTALGQTITGKKPISVQSYHQCCYENIAQPLHDALKHYGITHLIRGQRNSEKHKSPAKNGDSYEEITYLHPIEDWTSEEVIEYIARNMKLPEHYYLSHTSLDCFDCTAYQKDTKDVSLYREKNHPELHKQYLVRKEQLDSAIREALEI